MQENLFSPLLVLHTPTQGRKKRRKKSSFRYSSRRQLLRARMIRQLARITVIDLSGTIRNLTYEGIVSCKAIREDIVV